jgi:RNA polymerase sigma-70 factor (ECF subfamily)
MVTDAAEMNALLERCQRQDRAAFAELFNRYHLQVFRSAYLIARRQEAADDITQLVFVELFSAFHRFDLRRPFLPWLYRIVHNVSVDYLKRDRRGRALTPTTDAQFDLLLGPDPGPGPAEQAEQAELRRTIWAALEHLPVNQRTVLVLSYFGGLNEHEVAAAMGVRPGTVKSRLHRARHALRDTLARDHGAASLASLAPVDVRPLANPAQEGGE